MTIKTNFGVPVGVVPQHGNRPDLRRVGKDIYDVLTGTGPGGYKQRMRRQTVELEPERNLAPARSPRF
jgi:hypothetical protein